MPGASAATPPRRCGSNAGSLDVGFSDDQFLRRVLAEAQKGTCNAAAVARFEAHGFAPEVSRIALHVSGGDEQRALQLCMSGCSFMGAGGLNNANLLSPEKVCPPPAPLACYICGGSYLSNKSLDIHTKACRRRFEQREAKREPHLRRALLEEHELPEGVSTLEQYYELSGGKPMPDDSEVTAKRSSFEARVAKQQCQEANLLPCEHCKRTFTRDRLEKHQRVCVERPKQVVDIPVRQVGTPPARRKSTGSTASAASAGEKAYDSFCQNLTRCSGCSRQFRKEVLESHQKQCPAILKANQELERQRQRARAARTATASAATASTSTCASAPPNGAGGRRLSAAFVPAPRVAGGRAVATPAAPAASSVDESLQNSAALMARGFISRACSEDQTLLEAALMGSLPSAEFVGAYKVASGSQDRIYEALKSSVEDMSSPSEQESFEQQLWHGTSWAILAKILRHGFNRSFAGRHGTLLGMATYFSAKLAYSARFCDKRGGGSDGTKVMLLSRVLVGRYCKGNPTDVEPPLVDAETGQRYDSTVDNEENPSIFAVFRDFQALPLFLVEFRS